MYANRNVYSNRTPAKWDLAVSKDSRDSKFKINYPFVDPYFLEPNILQIGQIESGIDGNRVRIYDKECSNR